MSKRYFSLFSIATLLWMMLFGAVSCKKDGLNGGETPSPNEADFFIDVDFLPESETNGEVAPRLVVNFNDEAAMIELRRPSAGTPMETVLLLCPDHEAMMLCGNDNLMVCAAYDMETYTPSHDVLLVTPLDESSLLLTKGFIDWNTNTLTTGDMMVLPVDDISKCQGNRGDIDSEIREFFFNRLVKPLAKSFEKVEGYCGFFGSRAKLVFSYIRMTTVTGLTTLLYSEDSAELYSHMKQVVTTETTSGFLQGVLEIFPFEYSEMIPGVFAVKEWYDDGGHGKVKDYVGGNEEEHNIPYATQYLQAYQMVAISTPAVPTPMYYVNLNVGNVTENSVYLKGNFRYGSSVTPMEMGYIIKVDGGSEHIEHDMNFQGITLSGLQKATKYTAFAYVKGGFGDRVLSPGVTFWTLGFEAFPNSLTFPTEGDTKYVGLSYSHEDITNWDITSKPSWCTTSIDDLGLLAVTVGASTETRSGTITITAHSNTLGNVTENIEVTQLGANNWEGTSWKFSGLVTFSGDGSREIECNLTVNNISNNDFIISFKPEELFPNGHPGWNENYVINENGDLVYTISAMYAGDGLAYVKVTFVRTGSTTATADLNLYLPYDDWVTGSGLLQGTMIRVDEVKNYKTTVKLKTPIFDNLDN